MPRGAATQAVVITFLAPAERCNQRCPDCVLDIMQEPVRRFDRAPEDFARFVADFLEEEIPILSLSFQGYEVTLPRSWPYVEAVFQLAQRHDLRRSFITNGMLLDRRTSRIAALQPTRISISLDGTTPESNDPIRGLDGAFQATTRSVRRFLRELPEFADRMTIASCVHGPNFESLRAMPKFMRTLGITRWGLAFGVTVRDGIAQPVQEKTRVREQFGELVECAEREGVRCFVNDEFSLIGNRQAKGGAKPGLPRRSLPHEDFFYRVDPAGYVRTGREMLQVWNAANPSASATHQGPRHWDPNRDSAVKTVDYWEKLRSQSDSV